MNILNKEVLDVIVTEDKAAGYEFVKKVVNSKETNVIPAGGKSNLEKVVKHELNEGRSVCIIADGGGIGSEMSDIRDCIRLAKRMQLCLGLILPECFEEVLCNSRFIGLSKNVFEHFTLEDNNTEHYCERVIGELSKNKPFEYSHEKQVLSDCWVNDCATCNKYDICEYKITSDKLESVLSGGNAAALLVYYKIK